MPNTPEGPSASAPGSQTPSMAFTAHKPARHPLFHPEGRGCDDACSGFTHVTDRTVAPAPLRTRPLDHARGHSYQGPRHLPGPDSHRPAVLNLSLDLRHDELHLLTTPKQSGRTCATASIPSTRVDPAGPSFSLLHQEQEREGFVGTGHWMHRGCERVPRRVLVRPAGRRARPERLPRDLGVVPLARDPSLVRRRLRAARITTACSTRSSSSPRRLVAARGPRRDANRHALGRPSPP